MYTYGYPEDQWEKAKEEARDALINIASSQLTVTYKCLLVHIRAIEEFRPNDPRYHELLGQISTSEHSAGRGMLSALVVLGDKQVPGAGFFKLARRLGVPFQDRDEFWIREFKKVTNYWKEQYLH